MKYRNTLIAVNNMDVSLKFYKQFFNQDVILDFGWCKNLTCGITLQSHFDEIAGFNKDTMKYNSNTMELYFETDDFDSFIKLLDNHKDVKRLHDVKMFPWLQRGIRIFDPDGHIIEVSESMHTVCINEFKKGRSVKDVANDTQHPFEMVEQWYELYMGEKNYLYDDYKNDNLDNEIVDKILSVPDMFFVDDSPLKPFYENGNLILNKNNNLQALAIHKANYLCEVDKRHKTFLRKSNGLSYTESHYLIPLSAQFDEKFKNNNLDCTANIVSLCSNCHSRLHYGNNVESILKPLYDNHINELNQRGIFITYEELIKYYK